MLLSIGILIENEFFELIYFFNLEAIPRDVICHHLGSVNSTVIGSQTRSAVNDLFLVVNFISWR